MKKSLLLFIAIFTFVINGFSQDNSWKKSDKSFISEDSKLPRDTKLKEFLVYDLSLSAIKSKLLASPKRTATAVSNVIVSFPNPQGEMQSFKMYEASTLEAEIAKKHSEIQTYVGKCIEDPTATITITTTIFGLHAVTQSGVNGTSYIDPYTKDLATYVVYSKINTISTKDRICSTIEEKRLEEESDENQTLSRASNGLFKTYRLAMACTKQYGSFHVAAAGLTTAAPLAQRKSAVLAAMVITVARINSVYERDNSITLVLINNNTDIINVNLTAAEIAAGTPNPNLDDANLAPGYTLLNGNQAYVDGIIGFANYDFGHIASTGGGGVARNGICTSIKAEGVTGTNSPVGDTYDIDYVAHEMGHQLSGSHTFNSEAGSCGGGNRATSSSYEPGSGTTIMAYAGICSPENVQSNSDAYFHARSLIQINNDINGLVNPASNCAASVPNGNTAPVIVPMAASVIPKGTAFKLTGVVTDVDNPSGDKLTYCWEQYNLGSVSELPNATKTAGPNFRSFSPKVSPTRYFPALASVMSNTLVTTWEAIPNVSRTMSFSLVVRDNGGPLGGQTQRATKSVQFVGTAGPFKVTSQAALVGWAQNSAQTVTWDVAGTDANGINTTNVNILLSTDGGLTFPITLASNTANDGSEGITAPNLYSQNCRIMIEAVGNVYFAVNTFPFYIGYSVVNACNNYTGNTTVDNVFPFALNDGSASYTIKKFVVPATNVSDVNLTINATHPNIQNLKIEMLKQGGSLNTIFSQVCPSVANMNIKFDSQAPAFACANSTTGTYALPVGSLNVYNGNVPAGLWQIAFRDLVAGESGTINSVDLEICSLTITQLPPVVVANEYFAFQNLSIAPNPSNGNFTVKFDSGTNNKINIAVNDIRGRIVFEKEYQNAGFFSENLELNNMQKGIYLVTIKDGEKQIVKKIVVE